MSRRAWDAQATREADAATIWLIVHDAELRAKIDTMRAREGRPPININDPADIDRAARRLNERERKREKRGGAGAGWADIDELADDADPLSALLALECVREHVVQRIEIAASPRGGRPQGDIGAAQLVAMLRVLDSGKAAGGAA
jgi:hypothetical protein